MSLVSGPGRGGASDGGVPEDLKLVIENHVKYIQILDTVSCETILDGILEAHSLTAPR